MIVVLIKIFSILLNVISIADYLVLSDINNDHIEAISKTITHNELTNTKFIKSDGFKSFYIHNTFDTIIMNPPHYASAREGGYVSIEEELICMDKDLKFQKAKTFNERLFKTLEVFFLTPDLSFVSKLRKFTHYFVFQNFKKTLFRTLKSTS